MSSQRIETALIAALIGAGAAALTAQFVRPQAGRERGASPAAPLVSSETAARPDDLAEEVRLLALENERLRTRIEALESRPVPATRIPIEERPVAPELAASGPRTATEPLSPEFLSHVELALDQLRDEERAEAERARAEREAARLEERLARLTEDLGLSQPQVREMRRYLFDREDRRDELRRVREESDDREAYRQARELARADGRAELERILSPAQVEAYLSREDERDGERDDGRRGRDRGRRGDGGG